MNQEKVDLQAELEELSSSVDVGPLRDAFIEAAGRYAESKGLQRSAFQRVGVDVKTLNEAGIT